jgi:hypothetical protein
MDGACLEAVRALCSTSALLRLGRVRLSVLLVMLEWLIA